MMNRMSWILSPWKKALAAAGRVSVHLPTGDLFDPVRSVAQLELGDNRVLIFPSIGVAVAVAGARRLAQGERKSCFQLCFAPHKIVVCIRGMQVTQQELLYAESIQIGWKVAARGAETDCQRCFRIVRVVELVPLVGEGIAQAKGAIGADLLPKLFNNLLSIIETVQSGVLDGDQHIGDRIEIKRIGSPGHLKLPSGVDAHRFERQ